MKTASSAAVFSFVDWEGKAYNVDYRTIGLNHAPIKAVFGEVAPKSRSIVHKHFEVEAFLFLSGQGAFHCGVDTVRVTSGVGVQVDSFVDHVIENTSSAEPLRFISLYWPGEHSISAEPISGGGPEVTLVFSTPPTPNGDLHLGHLSGPYLAGDIFRRFMAATGKTCLHVTGRDDHQTYVITKAELAQKTPQDVADEYARRIRATLDACGIRTDYFIEPDRDGPYSRFVQRMFMDLYRGGYIVARTEAATFDGAGARYLHEAHIQGDCPRCKSGCDGNGCEDCGWPNRCVDLEHARDRRDGQPPLIRPCTRLYFRLSALTARLADYVKATPMSARALAMAQAMLDEGLPDICVSHPTDWGISVPVEGFESQKIYVWFEMAAGYLWAAANTLGPGGAADEVTRAASLYSQAGRPVVHFYGFDNAFYHTLLFPAIHLALDWGLRPPSAHVINELLDLDGKKFSTSRLHLIWGRDLLDRVPADYLRWFLCEIRPEGLRADFSLATFCESVNHMFPGTILTWAGTLGECVRTRFTGRIPEPGAWTDEQRQFYSSILDCRSGVLAAYTVEHFSPRRITRMLRDLADTTARFRDAERWMATTDGLFDYLRTSTALSALAIKIFALLARPIIPEIADRLLGFLGVDSSSRATDTSFLAGGTHLTASSLPELPTILEKDLEGIQHRG